jgi:hypothetical protein
MRTLSGLRSHQTHNGVQLEGLKRLATLVETGNLIVINNLT